MDTTMTGTLKTAATKVSFIESTALETEKIALANPTTKSNTNFTRVGIIFNISMPLFY